MNELRYTLISDGSSDQALLPILTWLLRQQNVNCPIQPDWADLRRLPKPAKKLVERLERAIELYPCELLFVHRDAERIPCEERKREILTVVERVSKKVNIPPALCVVPVRMQEAWLLFDGIAIRKAAGNPRGRDDLRLPPLRQLEDLPNPKEILHDLIREASGLNVHRQKKLHVNAIARRVAEFSSDFSLLRRLPAFLALEDDLGKIVQEQRWNL